MSKTSDRTFTYQQTILVLARGKVSGKDRTAAAVAVARGEGLNEEVIVEDWTALTDLASLGSQKTDIEIFDARAGEWVSPVLDIEAGRLLSDRVLWATCGRVSSRPHEGAEFSVTRCESGYLGEIKLNPDGPSPVRLLLLMETADEAEARFGVETEYKRWLRVRERIETVFPQINELDVTRISASVLAAGGGRERAPVADCAQLIRRMQKIVCASENALSFPEITEIAIYEPDFNWSGDVATVVKEVFELIARELWEAGYGERPVGGPDISEIDETVERIQLEPGPAGEILRSAQRTLDSRPRLRPVSVHLL